MAEEAMPMNAIAEAMAEEPIAMAEA